MKAQNIKLNFLSDEKDNLLTVQITESQDMIEKNKKLLMLSV